MKKISLLMFVALFLVMSISGCNAARGVGRDISDTGKHIEGIGK